MRYDAQDVPEVQYLFRQTAFLFRILAKHLT